MENVENEVRRLFEQWKEKRDWQDLWKRDKKWTLGQKKKKYFSYKKKSWKRSLNSIANSINFLRSTNTNADSHQALGQIVLSKLHVLSLTDKTDLNSYWNQWLPSASLIAQLVKNPPAMLETWVRSLGWKIPWRRERLPTPEFHGQCMGLQRVGHDCATFTFVSESTESVA